MHKHFLKVGLSVGLSFAIVALLLQMVNAGVPEGERPSVFAALQGTSLSLVLAYLGLYFVSLGFRAYRYRLLLQVSGEPTVPSIKQMWLVTGIRNMVVDMLPARLGELGYVALLNRGYGVKLEHCISSLTIAVAFDFVALFVVAILIVASQMFGSGVQGWAIGAMLMALFVSLVAVLGLFKFTPWFSRELNTRVRPKFIDVAWCVKALGLLEKFASSLKAVEASGATVRVFTTSVVIRILKYFGFFLLFKAVATPTFESLATLPVSHVLGALIGGEVGASLPIPTFMSFGAYEAGGLLVFKLLGISDQAAATVTLLCVHIWSQVMEYAIGGLLVALFIWLNRKGKRAENMAKVAGSPTRARLITLVSFIGAGAVLVLGSGFLAYQLRAASKLGALSAPAAGGVAKNVDEWQQLSKAHVSAIDGFVVFSSNRDGNHDIYRLDLMNYKLDKLTSHPHTETYPRISPDGSNIVFSRAHQVWVSQRNVVAWDIYVLNLETMQERRLVRNATAPRWLDNQTITYLKNGVAVERLDLASQQSVLIFEGGGQSDIPKGTKLQNPTVNAKSLSVTFTAKQNQIGTNTGHWGTAVTDGLSHRGVMNGCELAWSNAGDYLYQVNPDAETLRIMKINPATLNAKTLIDLAGEFSHEYWPKESNNGEYFVFGASRGPKDHEHDTKDYEIFLWKTGSDPSKATRLTFHTGNDNWPDVHLRN